MSFFPQTFKRPQTPISQIKPSFRERSCVQILAGDIGSYFTFLRKFITNLAQAGYFSRPIYGIFHSLN